MQTKSNASTLKLEEDIQGLVKLSTEADRKLYSALLRYKSDIFQMCTEAFEKRHTDCNALRFDLIKGLVAIIAKHRPELSSSSETSFDYCAMTYGAGYVLANEMAADLPTDTDKFKEMN